MCACQLCERRSLKGIVQEATHPAKRAFLNSTRKKGLEKSCEVLILLSMRKPLLGHSFKPRSILDRTPRRHTRSLEVSILILALSKYARAA